MPKKDQKRSEFKGQLRLTSEELAVMLKGVAWDQQLDVIGKLLSGELVLRDGDEEDKLGTRIAQDLATIKTTGQLGYPMANGLPITVVEKHWIAIRLGGQFHFPMIKGILEHHTECAHHRLINTNLFRFPILGLDGVQAELFDYVVENPVSDQWLLDSAYLRMLILNENVRWEYLDEMQKYGTLLRAFHGRCAAGVKNLRTLQLFNPVTSHADFLDRLDAKEFRLLRGMRTYGSTHRWYPAMPEIVASEMSVQQWSFVTETN